MVRPGAITKEITQTTSTKTHIITNTTTITNTNYHQKYCKMNPLRGLFLAYCDFAKDRFFLDLTQRRSTSEKENKILLRILFGFG